MPKRKNHSKREAENTGSEGNAIIILQHRPKIPHDILCLIFDQAAAAPKPLNYPLQFEGEHWTILQQEISNAWRQSSNVLASLSLVSKDWNTASVPFLYRYMRLRTEIQVWSAGNTLEYRHSSPSPWIGAPHGSFVRVIDVANGREIGDVIDIAEIMVSVSKLVTNSPHLRLFRTSAWDSVSKKSNNSTTRYATRILPGLLKNGSHLTTLEISDSRFQVPDLQRLVNGLPLLETFIVSTMLMMELETKQRKTVSTSLKTIVIIEPEGTIEDALCLYDTIFGIVSKWILPNFCSLLIRDRCRVSRILTNMKPLLIKHQETLQTIVFRRWKRDFSELEIRTMELALPRFKVIGFTETSAQFSKG